MADSTRLKRALYQAAVAVGRRYARVKYATPGPSLALRLGYRLCYWAMLAPLKRRLGFDRTRIAVGMNCSASGTAAAAWLRCLMRISIFQHNLKRPAFFKAEDRFP